MVAVSISARSLCPLSVVNGPFPNIHIAPSSKPKTSCTTNGADNVAVRQAAGVEVTYPG